MQRNLFFAIAVVTGLSISSTLGADLPSRKTPPADYLPPAPAFTWTGFYVGVNGGYGGGIIDGDLILTQPPLAFAGVFLSPGFVSTLHTSNRTGGFIAGGQAGFNYQFSNNVVLGLETDAQWTDVEEREHERAIGFPLGTVRSTDLHIGLDWFGTTRLRLGYAYGRFLPYLTGGIGYGQVSSSGFETIVGAGPRISVGAASATHVGWAAGAGAEFAITRQLSMKAEYLFVQLGGVSGPVTALVPPPLPAIGLSTAGAFGTHIVRVGLNWNFGGYGAAPVIAGPAVGADLPSHKGGPVYALPEPTYVWTGFYIGVNGGRGGGVADVDTTLAQPPLVVGGALLSPGFVSVLHASNRTGGFIAGGQVGYNYEFANHFVLSLESDAQWSDVKQGQHEKATSTAILIPISSARSTDQQIGLDWFGTTRIRLGYAFGRFLPYLTGGVAYGQVSGSGFQNIVGAGPGIFASSSSATHAGWTAGAGTEFAITEQFSLKAEYLYVQLGGVSGPVTALVPLPAMGSFTAQTLGTHVFRAGLNWKFGGFGAYPIAASY